MQKNTAKRMDEKLWGLVFAPAKMWMTRKNTFILTSQSHTQTSSLSSLYQSCNELPYEVFKRCCVDKDYSLLIKIPGGIFTQTELEDQWYRLYSEFLIISEDEDVKIFIDEWSELCVLESRIIRVKAFAKMLAGYYSAYPIKKLTELGHVYEYTREGYMQDLAEIESILQSEEAYAKELLAGIKNKQKQEEATGDDKVTYAIFDEKINQIERAFKVPIDVSKLTAQMYALKLKDLYNYLRELEEDKVMRED